MIFYVITPMQSSIFNTDTVIRSTVLTMGTNTTLVPLVEQARKLNLNFMEAAYGVTWLGQSLPSYSTNDLAFLPFQPVQESLVPLTNEQWITTAEAFYTNLTCTEADVIWKVPYYTFSDGKGCVVPYMSFNFAEATVTNVEASYVVAYIGYWDDPHNDWSLQNPNCSTQYSHNFLAVFAPAASVTAEGNYNNLTALFCETTYSTQTMHVTVNASNRAIHEYSPADENANMIELTDILNITNFEYLIGNGVPATMLTERYDFQDEALLQQQARFQSSGIVYPNTNMVGFAAGLTDVPIKSWSDPAVLQQVFQNAHQLLLVSAFGVLTQNPGNLTHLRTGVRQDFAGAIILVRSICIIVEIALGAVAIFTLGLWYICRKRPSKLTSDPASIADIMSMVRCTEELSDDLHDSNGRLNSVQLDAILAGKKYRLESLQNAMPRLSPMSQRLKRLTLSASSRPDSISENGDFSGVRSMELNLPIGFLFISLLLGAVAGILFIEIWASEHNGK